MKSDARDSKVSFVKKVRNEINKRFSAYAYNHPTATLCSFITTVFISAGTGMMIAYKNSQQEIKKDKQTFENRIRLNEAYQHEAQFKLQQGRTLLAVYNLSKFQEINKMQQDHQKLLMLKQFKLQKWQSSSKAKTIDMAGSEKVNQHQNKQKCTFIMGPIGKSVTENSKTKFNSLSAGIPFGLFSNLINKKFAGRFLRVIPK